MPLTTETTEDCLGIVHVGTGTVTGDEFVEASKASVRLVQSTQNFDYEFVDLSAATDLREMDDGHLEQITALDHLAALFRPNAVVIIVAPLDDFFEMGQRWERKVQDLGWSTHVVRTRPEGLSLVQKHFPLREEA